MKYKKTKHEGITSYKTKKGTRYRVRIGYDYDKEHSKSGFETLAEAKAYKAMKESDLIVKGNNIFEGNTLTFGKHWERYRNRKIESKEWNLSTIESSQYKIAPFLNRFKDMSLNDIQVKHIKDLIRTLYEDYDYSQETVQSYYNLFKQSLEDAIDDGIMRQLNFGRISYKKNNWKPKEKTISLAEYKEVMKLAKESLRADIYRAIYILTFGLRRGEVYGIRLGDITFLPNGLAKLNIQTQRTRNYSEGKAVKSSASNRYAILDETGTQYIAEQIEYARTIKTNLNQTLHKNDFIFIRPDGKSFAEKTLNDALNKVADLMDNPIRITPHMFRHMFVTYAIGAGSNPLQLKSVTGHADLKMTDHYTGSSDEAVMNVINATQFLRENHE